MVRCFAVVLALVALTLAQPAARAQERHGLAVDSVLVLDPGRDVERTDTVTGTMVNGAALKRLGQWSVSYNRSYETVEVVEAATLKADGRTVKVSADRILTSEVAPLPGPIHLPDVRLVSVVFPDLALGDRTRLVLKRTSSRPFGAYSESLIFPPWLPIDGFSLTVDAPEAAAARVVARDLAVATRREGDRVVHRVVYAGAPGRPPGRGEIDPRDWAPRIHVSEYRGWDDLGGTFLRLAEAASPPSPRVVERARQVAGHLTDPAQRVRAVFAHVAREFRYTAVYLGTGGIVPHAAAEVLERRYGDCKDLATLTRAMLAALDIDADYALVQAGAAYSLPDVPTLDAFNHVVLYVPALDLWLDPTDGGLTPGVLPVQLAGKPVLRVGRSGVTIMRTPDPVSGEERLDSRVSVEADGSIAVALTVRGVGTAARHVRRLLDDVEARGGEAVGRAILNKGPRGGTMVVTAGEGAKDARDDGATALSARAVLKARAFVDAVTLPSTMGLSGSAWRDLRRAATEGPEQAVTCWPERLEESITVSWPADRKLATVPRDGETVAGTSRYTARYRVEGASLVVERSMQLDPGGPVCDRAALDRIAPVLNAAARHEGVRLRFGAADRPEAAAASP